MTNIKKNKLLAILILFLVILLNSAKPVKAAHLSCEWSIFEEKMAYCVSGFESQKEGRDHEIVFSCTKSCGPWGERNTFDLEDNPFGDDGSGGYYTCLMAGGVNETFGEPVTNCIKGGKNLDECLPNIVGTTKKKGLFNDVTKNCSAEIPEEIILPYIEDAVKRYLGDPLLPTPTPDPNKLDSPYDGVTDKTFDLLNPLIIENSAQAKTLSTPGGIISRVLEFAFPIAGLILFIMLVIGGFGMVAGATDKKAIDAGRQRITSAIVGFILLFASFWIIRLIEMIFGLKIL